MPAGDSLPPAQGPDSGYVLIEMVATLALTVMLMAFVFPSVPKGTSASQLVALVTASVSLLREARTEAIAHGTPVGATFESARRMLRAGSQTVTIPTDVDFALVTGGNCPSDGGRARILFRPDGTNCGGVLSFARNGRLVLARVLWVNGRIDVAEGR